MAEGVPQREIARTLRIGRSTVARAVASDHPPKYERKPTSTSFTDFAPKVRNLLADTPTMPATVLAERVGWKGSITWFRDNVRAIRPDYLPRDPADRLTWDPGDAVQCDLWFPPALIPLEDGSQKLLPVLVMTATHSRYTLGRMIPTRHTEDLLLGMWTLLKELGRVPRRLLWDNEAGIGRGQRPAEGVASFMGTLATRLVQLKPYDPESKGVVERHNGYFETSFLPGRSFSSPGDFNDQFCSWLMSCANMRVVRTTKTRPIDVLGRDLDAMLALPLVPPRVGWQQVTRLGRDYYIRIASNDYSVSPSVIGAMVSVTADLDQVIVERGGKIVARHQRVWTRGTTVTDPDHVALARTMRQTYAHKPREESEGSLTRDLSDYDRAFGLEGIEK